MVTYFPHVAAYVEAKIDQTYEASAFHELLLELMARPGRVLARGGPPKWPPLVFDTCEALGGEGEGEAAICAAAAVEFIAAVTDIVDDLIDDEWDGESDQKAALRTRS
jgi:geranylgeranyl pyrophosphate synthase